MADTARGNRLIHPWHDLEPGDRTPEEFYSVIEIPLGSKAKYELDKPTGLIKLNRVLGSAACYPTNAGFIPRTLEKDGDPLDVLVLCQGPLTPLTLVYVRTLGLMTLMDSGSLEHKVVAVVMKDPEFAGYKKTSAVPTHYGLLLRQFFEGCQQPGRGAVTVKEIGPARSAYPAIRAALERYAAKYVRGRVMRPASTHTSRRLTCFK
jgi:inorganic pyrophosphatase